MASTSVVDAFTPEAELCVQWGPLRGVEGEKYSPAQVADEPTISIDASAATREQLYTVILSDPDAPNPTEPKFAEWLHWCVTNVPGSAGSLACAKGDVNCAYFGSAPGNGAGVHRYCLVVYAQGAAIADDLCIPLRSGFPPRRSFNSRAFVAKHGLRPVAVLTYRAEYDESCVELAKRIAPEA